MSYFYVHTCENGHFDITNKKLKPDAKCTVCSLPLIDKCPNCNQYIKKWTLYGATPILPGKENYSLPETCPSCGTPFPWNETYRDMKQACNEAYLARNGHNESTWSDYESSTYAFFPGCQLGAYEPEIVIKAYDSIRFQQPDTGIILSCCGLPEQNIAFSDEPPYALSKIKDAWLQMGKPTLITVCPECHKMINDMLPEIQLITIYEFLLDKGISGGCNSENYFIDDSSVFLQKLAEDMGVKVQNGNSGDFPYLTASITKRNTIKSEGKDSVHILELIFGMGETNMHLEHEHDHEHDHLHDHTDTLEDVRESCLGNCSGCAVCSASCNMTKELPNFEERLQNRLELKQMMLEFFW